MKIKFFILLLLLFLTVSCVSASEIDSNSNFTSDSHSINDNYPIIEDNNYQEDELLESSFDSNDAVQDSQVDDVIEVDSWAELQYYCSLKDKDYTLKLKDNTNFYPTKTGDSNYQIKVYNNVKIIGGNGSYIGDSSLNPRTVTYAAIVVPDGYKSSIYLENVTFKQISCGYQTDGVFFKMGGSQNSVLKNCRFENIETYVGHACIVHLSRGTATLENCSFINCKNGYGCISVYDPNSVKTVKMIVRDCYFEGNYASTEPGCINNCGCLIVYNTTFYKNRAAAWAGGIHTHNNGNTTIYDSNFTDNLAGWNGGALYTYSYLQIYNTVFSGNNCTTNNGGGAIGACSYLSDPHIHIENSLFVNNQNLCWSLDDLSTSGTGRGGAISIMDSGSFVVLNTTFIANSASIGAAICAWAMGGYGSPDMIIANNTFINHTRVGDTLNVRVDGTMADISNNYYYGNSIVFSNLTLVPISVGDNQAILQVNATLANPSFYDADILDRTLYDVYVNGEYYKTVNSSRFVFDFEDLDICDVYVIPTISNAKSNEINLISTREYIFVSKSRGDDSNNGISRDSPVSSIQKALELASTCHNILILDGEYEGSFQIDYDVTIKGENNVSFTNKTTFLVNSENFGLNNINVHDLDCDAFIKQSNGNLTVYKCVFEDNDLAKIIDADNVCVLKSIFKNNGGTCIFNNNQVSIKDSILLNNSKLIDGDLTNVDLNCNWWGNTLNNISKPNDFKMDNWLVLNSTVGKNVLENGQSSWVNFAFYLVENNQITKYDNLVKVNFEINTVNGSSSKNVTNFNSNVIYTQTGFGDGILTVSYNNVSMDTKFRFIKSRTKMSIQTADIASGQDVTVKISSSEVITGNITVYVGNVSKTQEINSNVATFVFSGIKAGDYTIVANYSGDKQYLSQVKYSRVSVSKSPSTTKISVKKNVDAVITVTVAGATGIVNFSINGVSQNVTLSNYKYVYTIKDVGRGDYLIKAIYYGDDKYLPSESSYLLEVDNIDPEIDISIPDSVYGSEAIVEVHLNDNATGSVSISVDGITNSSEVINSTAIIHISGLNAGLNKKVTIFYSGDDAYYSKTLTKYLNVNKANFTFNMLCEDIKIGQDAVIYINVPPRTSGNFTIGDVVLDIPLSGEVSYVISDLAIGEYEFTAVYNGDNYNTVSNSTSFKVIEYPIPQWANDGGDVYNTHKTDYISYSDGAIVWINQINSSVIGNLAIDSEGNIYVTAADGIYSFDSNGLLRWIYESPGRDGNFSGIAISRDVVISPRAGDTIYFINQSSGEKYGYSNVYQASSLFAPIVDDNAVIYTVSEYQYESRSYNLVVTPYRLWANGGDPKLISLGSTKPIATPSVNDDIYVVLGEKRLMVVDANTLETVFIKSGDFKNVRPVIGEGNIIYAALGDSIVAYTNTGSQIWKTSVSGGSAIQLAMDSELGLYAVNANGNLYRYDLFDGIEEFISDLDITSGILIDGNHNLFFGCDNLFYCIDSEGKVLWKSDLESRITGTPVMNKDGIIYIVSEDNKLFALSYVSLDDSGLEVSATNAIEGDDIIITIKINNQTTGNVSFTLNGVVYSFETGNGTIVKAIPNLPAGTYTVNVNYPGDLRFNKTSQMVTFTVEAKSVPVTPDEPVVPNTVIKGSDITVLYTSNSYYKVKLTQNNSPLAGKTIAINFNGANYNIVTDKNGIASFKITAKPGKYTIKASYQGKATKNTVTVKTIIIAKNIKAKKSSKKIKIKVSLKKVNGKYLKNKKITLKFNKKTFKAKTNRKGIATFKIKKNAYKKLKASKRYAYLVTYNKDTVKRSIKFKK